MTLRNVPGAPGDRIDIVMVAARFPPFIGGVETHVREVSRRLASMGDTVLVVTTDPVGDLSPREDIDGVQVVRVRARPRNGDLMFAPGIAPWIQPRGRTYVHCQDFTPWWHRSNGDRRCSVCRSW
jgi:glycosyltransferase involved in cell wall biosynthesis